MERLVADLKQYDKVAIDTNVLIYLMESNPSIMRTSILAAELRAKYGIKTPDALFLATAILENANIFVTNDVRLKRIEEMNFLILGEYKQ